MELLMEHLAKGFMTMLIISMPCVLIAAAVGLVVGILQAVNKQLLQLLRFLLFFC